MVVQCPSCATRFRLDETKIGAKGAKVRCSKCNHGFVVKRGETAPPKLVPVPVDPQPDSDTTTPMQRSAFEAMAAVTVPGPAELDAAATVPGPPASFFLGPPDRPAAPLPRITDPTVPGVGSSEPAIPDLPPAVPGGMAVGGSVPAVPELMHEAQTAVYVVPDSIRAVAGEAVGGLFGAGSSPVSGGADAAGGDRAPIDLGDINLDEDVPDPLTSVISPQVLAPIRAAARLEISAPASSTADIPMVDADLIDAVAFDDVTNAELHAPPGAAAPLAPANVAEATALATVDEEADDPFADHDHFAGAGSISADGIFVPPEALAVEAHSFGDQPSGPKALGYIQPALAGAAPAVAAVPSAEPLPQTVAIGRPRRRWSIGIKIVTTLVGLILLALGVLLFASGGRIDTLVAKLGRGKLPGLSTSTQHLGYREVVPVAMRSVLYPTRNGLQILVFAGDAENRATESRQEIDVVAELRDRVGRLAATARAPLGVTLTPPELYALTDADSLKAAYQDAASKQPPVSLASRATASFSVVLLNPPAGLSDLTHSVRLEQTRTPRRVEPPPPAPEPIVADESKVKGKKAKKAKKAKRKSKAVEELEPPG